jgi:diketogulonate reductase-like aldo/keto reductase
MAAVCAAAAAATAKASTTTTTAAAAVAAPAKNKEAKTAADATQTTTTIEADARYARTRCGGRMPRMLYGTAWKKERTTKLVLEALRAGFVGVDTAAQPKHYDEKRVGDAIRAAAKTKLIASTDACFIQTKFTDLPGQDVSKPLPYDKAATIQQQVQQSVQTSLKHLPHIDSLVLHSPMRTLAETLACWRVMEAEHKAGRVRQQLGISNCYDARLFAQLFKAATVKPAVLQNRFYARSGYDTELRRFCRANGVVYQSFWTLSANDHIVFRSGTIVAALAKQHHVSAAAVFYRFCLQQDINPLNGSTDAEHMKNDQLALFRKTKKQDGSFAYVPGFTLSDDAVKQIWAALLKTR